MGIIEAIRKGFGIASKNLGMVLVLFVFNLIWNLVSIPFLGAGASGAQIKPEMTAAAVIVSIIFIIISVFVQSGALAIVRDYIKTGKIKLDTFLANGAKYYIRLFSLGLLIVLIIGIVALIAALIVIATTPLNNTVVTIIAALIAITIGVVGIYYILLLVMAPYAIVCDELGVIEAMKKSVKVVRKAVGRVIALLALLILIAMGLGFVVGILTGLVTVAVPAGIGQVILALVNSIFNGYLGIVMMGSFTLFYLALVDKDKISA